MASVIQPAMSARPNYVTFSYTLRRSSTRRVDVEETTNRSAIASGALHFDGPQATQDPTSADTTLALDGVTLTKSVLTQGDNHIVGYRWEQRGVYYFVYGTTSPELTGNVLQQMVASMVEQGK